MSCYEIISCAISAIAVVLSGVVAFFAFKNLKEIRKQFFEQNRGNLVFYIDKIKPGVTHSLILKNYGNSPSKLISLKITPDIDWSKSNFDIPSEFKISNCKNVFIAPKQYISSDFLFDGYPDKQFEILLSYETCGKTISESYNIDISYSHFLVSTESEPENELKALIAIKNSIRQLSERFL